MKREDQIYKIMGMGEEPWDVAVIGGGATGAGIALDSVLRGYRTVLLEAEDFAKGTSSRSTKLVHGGVRYLAKGDLLLVREALRERGIILKNAPGITGNSEFVVPVYKWYDAVILSVGLKFYDLLAGRLSLGKSRFIGRKETVDRIPNLKDEGLLGGIVYHDGSFDDARLNIELIKASETLGAAVLNYCPVTALCKGEGGKILGLKAFDKVSGKEIEIRARVVINASGVFANGIIKLDDEHAKDVLKPSRGAHILTDIRFLGGSSALMIPKTDDGRVLFAIPWHGKALIGTTDVQVESIESEPVPTDQEVEFILRNAKKYMKIAPTRRDIISVFAGLRPLASDSVTDGPTKEISRRHRIILSDSGLVTVTGGKWTTYRLMARETLDLASRKVGLKRKESITDRYQIYKGDNEPPETAEKNGNTKNIDENELRRICRSEMPVKIEDILARRTRIMLTDPEKSRKLAETVADIMAGEFGHGEGWKEEEIKSYIDTLNKYLV
jgi:glycerol-3-phosphate dehydrogenase